MSLRKATISRETAETKISVTLNLDGKGQYQIETGNGMLDHLLAQLSRHSQIDLKISAKGDVQTGWHHTVEDLAIVLGRALRQAIGDGKGITRMAHAFVPLDEALAMTAIDLGGRGYAVLDMDISNQDLNGLPADLLRHFLESFSREGGFTLHAKTLAGVNNHHKAEATFKALAKALKDAVRIDDASKKKIPSTKGTISK